MMLLKISNPNPKVLVVLRDVDGMELRLDTLSAHGAVEVVYDPHLRLYYAGKRAVVILEASGGLWDGEQWAQEVIGGKHVAPDPEKAIEETKGA